MTVHLAPHNTQETAAWLANEQRLDHRYFRRCLILQRTARGIPSLAPTAFAASLLVPKSERVTAISSYRRGMIGFSKGTDPSGHVFFVLGRRKGFAKGDPDGVLTRSNDTDEAHQGAIRIVPLSFYHNQWGHNLLFAATWLNGYDFADFNAPPKAVHPNLGVNYEQSIEALKRVIHAHANDHDKTTLNAVKNDLARMEKKYKKFAA